MLRQRLLLVSALCSAACAQIAGFDHLSSRSSEAAGGGNSAGGAETASKGGNAGAFAGHGSISGGPGAHGGTPSHAGSGGNVSNGSGGSGETNSAGSGGKPANGGRGGNGAVGGSAPIGGGAPIGGSAPTAGAGGGPVIGGCNAQLLKNANFDAGPVDWRQDSTAPGILEVSDIIVKGDRPALVAANVAPVSGNYLAWLGGTQNTDKGTRMNLLQDVQIPLKVSRLVISGYLQIKTTEPDPKYTADQLDLSLQDDVKPWSFKFWKGTDVTNGWKSFSYGIDEPASLDAMRGRTLTFYAETLADTSEISSFWLDSISLVAECPH